MFGQRRAHCTYNDSPTNKNTRKGDLVLFYFEEYNRLNFVINYLTHRRIKMVNCVIPNCVVSLYAHLEKDPSIFLFVFGSSGTHVYLQTSKLFLPFYEHILILPREYVMCPGKPFTRIFIRDLKFIPLIATC